MHDYRLNTKLDLSNSEQKPSGLQTHTGALTYPNIPLKHKRKKIIRKYTRSHPCRLSHEKTYIKPYKCMWKKGGCPWQAMLCCCFQKQLHFYKLKLPRGLCANYLVHNHILLPATHSFSFLLAFRSILQFNIEIGCYSPPLVQNPWTLIQNSRFL